MASTDSLAPGGAPCVRGRRPRPPADRMSWVLDVLGVRDRNAYQPHYLVLSTIALVNAKASCDTARWLAWCDRSGGRRRAGADEDLRMPPSMAACTRRHPLFPEPNWQAGEPNAPSRPRRVGRRRRRSPARCYYVPAGPPGAGDHARRSLRPLT
jgi:hypothetical protein